MRFGAFLLAPRYPKQDVGTPLDASLAAAVAAEDAGFDDVWIAEHHFMSYGVCPSAVTMAGFLLGATRRITVGTAVSVLSTQHPVALAEQAALLDRLSGGRFVLGVGRGARGWSWMSSAPGSSGGSAATRRHWTRCSPRCAAGGSATRRAPDSWPTTWNWCRDRAAICR